MRLTAPEELAPLSRLVLYAPLAAALASAALAGAARAADEPVAEIRVGYHFNVMGAGIGEMAIEIGLNEESYEVRGAAQTVGIIDMITHMRITAETEGALDGAAVRPAVHTYTYSERGKTRRVTLDYDEAGMPSVSADPPFTPSFARVPLPDDKRVGTLDPASPFVVPVLPGKDVLAAEQCNRTISIFEGQLRLDATLSHISSDEGTKVHGANYEGPIVHCSMTIHPVGGHREGDYLSRLETMEPPEVWFAPVVDGRYLLPIKLAVRTPFGPAELVARSISVRPAAHRASLGQ